MPLFIISICLVILLLSQSYKHYWNEPLYIEELDNTEQIEDLNNEILNLEIIIQRDNKRAAYLEKELKTATPKQTETILNKLNTIDKQTLRHRQKINKLNLQLKELE